MRRVTAAIFAVALNVTAEDQARVIWDSAMRPSRPTTRTGAVRPKSKPGATVTTFGLTLWRCRPSQTGEPAETQLVAHAAKDNTIGWTPERISTTTALVRGDRIRMSVEAPDSGFLYIFDREQLRDGSLGKPYLIFPNLNMNGGDNRIAPGRLIEVPSRSAASPWWVLSSISPEYVGELLTIVISAKPLLGIQIGPKEVLVAEATFAAVMKRWGGNAKHYDMAMSEGTAWTRGERAAGEGKRLLTQDDPPPQTIVQVSAPRPGGMAFTIPLLLNTGRLEPRE